MRVSMIMRSHAKAVTLTVSLGLIGLAATTQANAGCMDDVLHQMAPTNSSSPYSLVPAVYRPGASDTSLMLVNNSDDDAAIVGLWEFKLSDPLGDFGTQSFHAGGTETMFSAGVNPAQGDVCQGVWRKIGRSTYTLNHIAMAWTPGVGYEHFIHFHMVIWLAPSGNSYRGNFEADIFNAPKVTPDNPFPDESKVAPDVTLSGTASGRRVKPD